MNQKEFLLKEKYGAVRGGQAKLARDLNTKQSTVRGWFNGQSRPGTDYVIKLAKVFNKTEHEIMDIFGMRIYQNAVGNKDIKGNINTYICDEENIKNEIEKIQLKLDLLIEMMKTKK